MNLWVLVIATTIGCYLLKFVGYVIPPQALEHPRTKRALELLPVALLAALAAVQLLSEGRHLHADWPRLAAFGVALVAAWRRAPFLVVIVSAAATAALLRLI